jgi:hypothetical protein
VASLLIYWFGPKDPVPARIFSAKICLDGKQGEIKQTIKLAIDADRQKFVAKEPALRGQYEGIVEHVRDFVKATTSAAQRDGLSEHEEALSQIGKAACDEATALYASLLSLANITVSYDASRSRGENDDYSFIDKIARFFTSLGKDRKERLKQFEVDLHNSLWPRWADVKAGHR